MCVCVCTRARKFDTHFKPKKMSSTDVLNFTKERKWTENRERNLSEDCMTWQKTDFSQKNYQIRDRLVMGLKSKKLSEKLQLREDLRLKKAVEIACSYEQVKTQMEETQDKLLDAVTGERKETTKHSRWKSIHKRQQIRCDVKNATNIINLITVQQKEKFAEIVIK